MAERMHTDPFGQPKLLNCSVEGVLEATCAHRHASCGTLTARRTTGRGRFTAPGRKPSGTRTTYNRKNAGVLETELVYDPSSDRPRLTTKPDASLPLLPTFGIRVRF